MALPGLLSKYSSAASMKSSTWDAVWVEPTSSVKSNTHGSTQQRNNNDKARPFESTAVSPCRRSALQAGHRLSAVLAAACQCGCVAVPLCRCVAV